MRCGAARLCEAYWHVVCSVHWWRARCADDVIVSSLNLVDDIPIDYVHAVLEGVTKWLMCANLKIVHSPSILVKVAKLTELWYNNIHHLSLAGLQDPSMEVIGRLQYCRIGCCTTLSLCWLTSCHHCISITALLICALHIFCKTACPMHKSM